MLKNEITQVYKKTPKDAEEWLKRQKIKKTMLTILTSACNMPPKAYLDALDEWVDGKLTLEELMENTEKGCYL